MLAALIALALSGCLGIVLIPWLKKIHFGQAIKGIGPTWHKSKEGTPTMGGFMFIIGSTVALLVGVGSIYYTAPQIISPSIFSQQEFVRLLAGVVAALLYAAVGFFDDYLKVVRHNNAGLYGWYKILFQVLITAAYLAVLTLFGGSDTTIELLVFGSVDLGVWYYLLSMVFIVGMVNAVNLTDGLDGLAASVTFVVAASYVALAALVGCLGFSIWAAALAGACAGFLLWNFYPAKVFMGDTGSMFLGSAVVALGYGLQMPTLIIITGIVYLCEAGSVILQTLYFKATHGKRIFKMAPIHHHFEMCGMSEVQIDLMFVAVTALFCGIAIVLAIFR